MKVNNENNSIIFILIVIKGLIKKLNYNIQNKKYYNAIT
jgi:hypothetical protein